MENVCVLLSSYNGEEYIREQLDSLIQQENVCIDIIVRDDGSEDKTINILNEYSQRYHNISLLDRDRNIGVANSFIALLKYALKNSYDYYFFCDQDDVWMEDKCRRAIEKIGVSKEPALYFSKKEIVDSNLQKKAIDDRISFSGCFWDIFSQSNVSGCTMCFNRSLAEKIVLNDFCSKPYLHDAFIYRLSVIIKARIIYDDRATIYYRQHSNNVAGSIDDKGILERLNKKSRKSRKNYMKYLLRDVLETYCADICPEYKRIITLVCKYDEDFKSRCLLIWCVMLSDARISIKGKVLIKIMLNLL